MGDIFQILLYYELLIELNFWLGIYVPYILKLDSKVAFP